MNRAILIIVIVITSFILSRCTTSAAAFTPESGQIPPHFKGYSGTLLIMKSNRFWNKLVEEKLLKNYKGEYAFITEDDLIQPEFDNDNFRFMLTKNDYMMYQNHAGMSSSAAAMEDICIVDRNSGRMYCSKQQTSFIGRLVDNYTKALEMIRIEK